MAAYWIYRRLFGLPTPSLDAVARGTSRVPLSMDFTPPPPSAVPPVTPAGAPPPVPTAAAAPTPSRS